MNIPNSPNLIHLLLRHVETRPDAVALIEGTGRSRSTCTFAELDQRSRHVARQLRCDGLAPGDVVCLAQPVSVNLYVVLAGLLRAGLVAMIPDASAGLDRLAACCRTVAPDAIVGPGKAHLLRLLRSDIRAIPRAYTTGRLPLPRTTRLDLSGSLHAGDDGSVEPTNLDDAAVLSFTSGSTGTPKTIARSHGLLRGQYEAIRDALDLRPGQTDLSALPVFVLANLAAGVTTVLPNDSLQRPGAVDPVRIGQQLRAERPDRLTASPAFIERLLVDPDALSSLRRIDTGGAPVPYALQQRIRHAAPHAELTVVYGSSEAEPIAHVAHRDVSPEDVGAMERGDGLLVGRAVESADVRILPDRWGTPIGPFSQSNVEAQSVPTGASGEIVVAGPHVVPGYLDADDAVHKIQVDGTVWHRTGDAGRIDAQGRLWLLGRCSERLHDPRAVEHESTSLSAYPFSVEIAAASVDGVARAAALMWDGVPCVVLERGSGARNDSALAADALGRLSDSPIRRAYVVEHVPVDRRHNAKVDYTATRAMLEREEPEVRNRTDEKQVAPAC